MAVTSGRWQRYKLQRFFDRIALAIMAGAITNLLLMLPPQHGKSRYWSEKFPAWYIGHRPDSRVVLSSYEHNYASSWGRATRDLIEQYGPQLFGIKVRQDTSAAHDWQLDGYEGGMVTAGVGGPLTGRAADLAIVDDPIKNAEEAESPTIKAKIWDWWDSTLSTRVHEGGVRIVLMTRWAVDDLVGRIEERARGTQEEWTIIRLPAIAEADENLPEFGWTRQEGEALCPELFTIDTLRKRERNTDPFFWATMYQQRPYPRGGGDLKGEWFKSVEAAPAYTSAVRAWDLAASESSTAKRTAGVLMTKRRDGNTNRYHFADVKYGRWNPGRRNAIIVETAKQDGKGIPVIFEQEGGSGGKAQIEELIRLLDGWTVKAVPATGSKELRAGPLAAQASVGNVTIMKAPWNGELINEVNAFPGGPTIDMVDAGAHAYNYLAGGSLTMRIGSQAMLPGNPIFPVSGGRIL